jgi:hypothetical protein
MYSERLVMALEANAYRREVEHRKRGGNRNPCKASPPRAGRWPKGWAMYCAIPAMPGLQSTACRLIHRARDGIGLCNIHGECLSLLDQVPERNVCRLFGVYSPE